MNDNIEERINLQKALFEIEDANLYNKHELGQLDEFLEAGKCGVQGRPQVDPTCPLPWAGGVKYT